MVDRTEIEDAHYRVHEHVRHIHALWYMFRQIFRAPSEKQRLLGEVLPEFFVLFEKALIRTIFLEFRLLTEKPETAGRRNASLPGLLEALHGATWASTPAGAQVAAVQTNNTVRQHVNRVIAHIDWNTAAGVERRRPR